MKTVMVMGISLLMSTALYAGGTLPLKMEGNVAPKEEPQHQEKAVVDFSHISEVPVGPNIEANDDYAVRSCRTRGLSYYRASGTVRFAGQTYRVNGVCGSERSSSREIHGASGAIKVCLKGKISGRNTVSFSGDIIRINRNGGAQTSHSFRLLEK